MTQEQFNDLYQKWRLQQLTETEWYQFQQTATDPAMKSMLSAAVQQDLELPEFDNLLTAGERQEAYRQLMEQINASQANARIPVHRVHFVRTTWFKYAAAIFIVLGFIAYLLINTRNNKELVVTDSSKPLKSDVAPGGEKAILTLADGTKIVLDSAANGNLAQQGNAQVVKLSDGHIIYNLQEKSGKEVMWNTMSTPAGGQYQVILPDGTKVWLNASSSITYPTAFIGNERLVKIAGEVYLEVAKNKEKPFKVDVDGKARVEALGTSFNINSYADEGAIKTTLLEGSVRVSHVSAKTALTPVILKPGQQAIVASADRQAKDTSRILVKLTVDIEQILAWKNGIFNFNGADLFAVMRQLERWYDIKVQYKGSVSNVIFQGEMYRNANLSDVLEALQKMGVKFNLEGRTVTVSE